MGSVMIKKVAVDRLRPGMFVHDLGLGWLDHTFLRNRFPIKDESQIEKLREHGVSDVYIDTDRGDDVPDAPTQQEIDAQVKEHLAAAAAGGDPGAPTVPLKQEMIQARKLHAEAVHLVHSIMNDARLGKQIQIEQVEPLVERMVGSILRNRDAILILSRVKRKDDYTFQHSVGVCALMMSFVRSIGFEGRIIEEIGIGGLLHDIGKMMVPEEILNKPGKLTEDEFKIMKEHVELGLEVLEQYPEITPAALIVTGQHHERMDGSGYPAGLKGDEITQFGQMAAIVDIYDAVTSNRVYHTAMEPAEALRKMFEWSPKALNRDLVDQFVRTLGIYPVGTLVRLKSNRLAVVLSRGKQDPMKPAVSVVMETQGRRLIGPQYLNLEDQSREPFQDKIVAVESPQAWGIEPARFL